MVNVGIAVRDTRVAQSLGRWRVVLASKLSPEATCVQTYVGAETTVDYNIHVK